MYVRTMVAALVLGVGVAAMPAQSGEIYSLLFRGGVLADLTVGERLSYSVHRTGHAAPVPAESQYVDPPADARIELAIKEDDEVTLAVVQGQTSQHAGSFPRSVGNPLIMYFLETVLRDMATQAGGSPFYIRNRIKEALLRDGDVEPVTLSLQGQPAVAQEITLRPFATDAARDRMFGFADLALVAVVSDEVPGWYYSLTASAPAAPGDAGPGYSNAITLLPQVGK